MRYRDSLFGLLLKSLSLRKSQSIVARHNGSLKRLGDAMVHLLDSVPIPLSSLCEWTYSNGRTSGKKVHIVYNPHADHPLRAKIATTIADGTHAVLLVDQASWHMPTRLSVPPNITIIALSPKSPELNPMENIWQLMCDNWHSNRIFKSWRQ